MNSQNKTDKKGKISYNEIMKKRVFKAIIKKNNSDKVAISGDKILKNYIELNDAENKIINYLQKNNSISNKEAREVTGLSPSGVRKVFNALIQKGLIIAFGDRKSRYYKLYSLQS